MSARMCIASTRGGSGVTQVRVRSGPGVDHAVVTQLPVGLAGLRVIAVQEDGRATPNPEQARPFQWVQVRLSTGQSGWIREDLIELWGDCAPFGYGQLSEVARADLLPRAATDGPDAKLDPLKPVEDGAKQPGQTPDPVPVPPPAEAALDRVRKAAFNITAGFEGGGYASYQTVDSGIVSYGRFQATLASGSLETMLNLYLRAAVGAGAEQLRDGYMTRIRAKDPALRHDAGLRALLVSLSTDPVMRAAQDEFAAVLFWQPAVQLSADPRGITSALGLALVFDMAINHGRMHDLLGKAEESLGVPLRSRTGQNGISEQQLIRRTAEVRRDRLYAIAAKHNLGGLRVRGDYWVRLAEAGDWDLQGDANGESEVKPGRKVQVRTP
ncbi:MAG: SH3 domain-containing protein [bacterium]|nr:SH3 domain-containing protein [bacterium]